MTSAIKKFLLKMAETDRTEHFDFLGSYRIGELVLDACTHTDDALDSLFDDL